MGLALKRVVLEFKIIPGPNMSRNLTEEHVPESFGKS